MDNNQLLGVLDLYERRLIELSVEAIDYPHHSKVRSRKATLGHVLGMLPKMREFVAEGRRDKLMRWLGFAQGVLWSAGVYSLEDLKNHNR